MKQKINGALIILFIIGFISFMLFSISNRFKEQDEEMKASKKTADSIEINKVIDSVTVLRIREGD